MKEIRIFFWICFSISLGSCKYFKEKEKPPEIPDTEKVSYTKNFPVRPDSSITPANAYNEMFLNTSYVDEYIKRNKLTPADSIAITGFYNLRNYEFTWFANDGLTEQGRAFWNAYTYAKTHGQKDTINDNALMARMDTILNTDTLHVAAHDTSFHQIEVALTRRFLRYYNQSDPQSLIHQLPITQLLPSRKTDPLVMADSVLSYQIEAMSIDTVNNPYFALKKQLGVYNAIAKNGGWKSINMQVGTLKKGISSPIITEVKKRLLATEEPTLTDTTAGFTDSLEIAVKSFQKRNGLDADGVITDSLVTIMNVPVEQRIQQILVNMNRMAWLPPQVNDNYVSVNIPAFMLAVHEGDSTPVEMEVVVGKEGTNTMMFTGDLNQVVFSPVWHLPASIVKNEVLPEMKNNPNYLKSKNMVVVRHNDSLPEINQLPGPGNAMGKVKFLFPNSYDIYLHDTEAKELFMTKKRAFSHGCIRLADAEKMSEYVLRSNENWNSERIQQAMNGTKEQPVTVKVPIPVMITYFTSWVDTDGNINFREDIYQHDKRTQSMMFNNS